MQGKDHKELVIESIRQKKLYAAASGTVLSSFTASSLPYKTVLAARTALPAEVLPGARFYAMWDSLPEQLCSNLSRRHRLMAQQAQ
jgi:hypothetical protein